MAFSGSNRSIIPAAAFRELFVRDVPLLDVRAPIEFSRGAFPASHNIPLLDDAQRESIGITYKQSGQRAAIEAGERMATPEVRRQRIDAWRHFATENTGAVLYCFRGGLRSQITQRWLSEAGMEMPLVNGGYKALRRYLIDQLDYLPAQQGLILVSGCTGAGKTELLQRLPAALDLEALAHHRGSSFGARGAPQPTPINFENAIAVKLLKHQAQTGGVPLFVEDEGRLIGRLRLPHALEVVMARAPRLQLESAMGDRVERILDQYVIATWKNLQGLDDGAAVEQFSAFVLGNLDRIRRRLGGKRHGEIRQQWEDAMPQLVASGDADGFRAGIERLLREYYDPMYEYQLQQRGGTVLARGSADDLLAYVDRMECHAHVSSTT